jgi:deoxycytidylate deaminase
MKLKDTEVFNGATHPELVFGLVGPIGVNMDSVQERLAEALRHVGYGSTIIHITKILKKYETESHRRSKTEYEQKISAANAFCKTAKNAAALAGLAMLEINNIRRDANNRPTEAQPSELVPAIPKMAYVIRQLKRHDEIQLLRKVYGDKFIQISVSLDKEARIANLINRMSTDHPGMKHSECDREARALIEVDEHEENTDFGQQVGDIFHLGDFFVNAGDSKLLGGSLLGFIKALFGDNSASPNRDEFGAYMAATAALRSVDLSRQVGSAILSKEGDIIAVGCNEVPKAGGGNYWYDDANKMRDIERGGEQNSIEKQRIIIDFIQNLQKYEILPQEYEFSSPEMKKKLADASSEALISDITEYGRMTHAEMSAICDAARLGRSLAGATIYVTTFPCHNCAKHIVASGIDRVVYIEPYPKSRALTSHTDAISAESNHATKVTFEHFEGISPIRYRNIFQKGKRRIGQKIQTWYEGEPRPRVTQRENLHVRYEEVASNLVLEALKANEG